MTLLNDCVKELIDALLAECLKKSHLDPIACVAKNYMFYVVVFAISTILLLTANTALLAAMVTKMR